MPYAAQLAPIGVQRSMASSTACLAAVPLGSTRHTFMMLRYCPASAADLRRREQGLGFRDDRVIGLRGAWQLSPTMLRGWPASALDLRR